MHLITGWYDLFTRYQLEDYQLLKAAGHRPYLTVGPTSAHEREQLCHHRRRKDWRGSTLISRTIPSRLRQHPVRIFVMGSNEWREMDDWPPPAQDARYFLHSQRQSVDRSTGGLSAVPDRYIYDPGNPTPAYGGPLLSFAAGPHDQRALESRSDVLTYTTDPLGEDIEVIGIAARGVVCPIEFGAHRFCGAPVRRAARRSIDQSVRRLRAAEARRRASRSPMAR